MKIGFDLVDPLLSRPSGSFSWCFLRPGGSAFVFLFLFFPLFFLKGDILTSAPVVVRFVVHFPHPLPLYPSPLVVFFPLRSSSPFLFL
jgi:hypothetical protein